MTLYPSHPFPWKLPLTFSEDAETESVAIYDQEQTLVAADLDLDRAKEAIEAINRFSDFVARAKLLVDCVDKAGLDFGDISGLRQTVEQFGGYTKRRWTYRARDNDVVQQEDGEWLVNGAGLDDRELWRVRMSKLVDGRPNRMVCREVVQSGEHGVPLLVIGHVTTVYVRTA